ncbi:uncharacterized protein LOC129612734 [Condylostylus longicornis]|uniref:uncharacterized protein LOC129612734 n=1 Tax=Condylostylus longicornis TaxID=2530218 RepID=UPI00244E24F7|nr:uncharacterized protein LOC129612734 [Condylostylus longicornis]
MSKNGAVLQSFNIELVKYTEFIRDRNEQISLEIKELEEEKKQVTDKIIALEKELSIINKNLDEKYKKKEKCQQAIDQSNIGIGKLLDSIKSLTSLMRKEAEQVQE